jgi:hypothetical protein
LSSDSPNVDKNYGGWKEELLICTFLILKISKFLEPRGLYFNKQPVDSRVGPEKML